MSAMRKSEHCKLANGRDLTSGPANELAGGPPGRSLNPVQRRRLPLAPIHRALFPGRRVLPSAGRSALGFIIRAFQAQEDSHSNGNSTQPRAAVPHKKWQQARRGRRLSTGHVSRPCGNAKTLGGGTRARHSRTAPGPGTRVRAWPRITPQGLALPKASSAGGAGAGVAWGSLLASGRCVCWLAFENEKPSSLKGTCRRKDTVPHTHK
jgi:hypothetical protein